MSQQNQSLVVEVGIRIVEEGIQIVEEVDLNVFFVQNMYPEKSFDCKAQTNKIILIMEVVLILRFKYGKYKLLP